MRLKIKMMTLSIIASAVFVGCGSSSDSTDSTPTEDNTSISTTVEVAGPGGAFAGATEFSTAMVAGQSIYHWFDDNEDGKATKDEWLRATFEADGTLLKSNEEISGTYTVENGKIIINDADGISSISLIEARATEWDVRFDANDESHTWLLELKYKADLLVGKKFSVTFDPIVIVEYAADNTAKGYDTAGNLIDTIDYVITDGILIHRPAEDADERFLMKVEADGSLLAWHPVETEADLFTLIK